MKQYAHWVAALGLLPASLFAIPSPNASWAEPLPANTLVYQYSSETDARLTAEHFHRRQAYPTQIVRVAGDISAAKVSCETVSAGINELFNNQIPSGQFFYNTYIFCGYDPETKLAQNLMINSYFDPLSDQAIAYYEQYKADVEGQDLFGLPFHIEDAKGLIVAMNVMAGLKDSPSDHNLYMFRNDSSTHYFATNYDMMKDMVTDIKTRFHGEDPKLILPFLDRWLFDHADKVYGFVLRSSNYIELHPARIFIMEEAPKAFSSKLRYSYAKQCFNQPSGYCL